MDSRLKPTWRKPAGIILMLAYIAAYVGLIGANWQIIAQAPVLLQALIYLFLGVIWIAPLKPLLVWMETGKWRE